MFLWYYASYLPSFPQHRALVQTWTLEWVLGVPTLLLAYGPIGLVALARLWSDRRHLDIPARFFVVCFAVCFVLAKHDWLIQPRQPLHFTHGYVWMPLCLLALPLLQRGLVRLRAGRSAFGFGLLLLPVAALGVSDDAVFVAEQGRRSSGVGVDLSPADREMFSWIDRQGLSGILLCTRVDLSYLSATYTSVRPYLGHVFNTPDWLRRNQDVGLWLTQARGGPWMAQVDYVLFWKGPPLSGIADWQPWLEARVDPGQWASLHENREWALFGRRTAPPQP